MAALLVCVIFRSALDRENSGANRWARDNLFDSLVLDCPPPP